MEKNFQARLRACIGTSVAAFARLSGVPDQNLRNYLTKGSEPSATAAIKIAKAAGVDVVWLMTGEGTRETRAAGGRTAEITEHRRKHRRIAPQKHRRTGGETRADFDDIVAELDAAFLDANANGKIALLGALRLAISLQEQRNTACSGGGGGRSARRKKSA